MKDGHEITLGNIMAKAVHGGSNLAVPILTYVVGMAPRDAIASSLFIVDK